MSTIYQWNNNSLNGWTVIGDVSIVDSSVFTRKVLSFTSSGWGAGASVYLPNTNAVGKWEIEYSVTGDMPLFKIGIKNDLGENDVGSWFALNEIYAMYYSYGEFFGLGRFNNYTQTEPGEFNSSRTTVDSIHTMALERLEDGTINLYVDGVVEITGNISDEELPSGGNWVLGCFDTGSMEINKLTFTPLAPSIPTSSLGCITNVRSNTVINPLSCITNVRSNTQLSVLECITNIITNHEISSLECITNMSSGGLFHTGFAIPELPSEIILNEQLGNFDFGICWYSALLDTINQRLDICHTPSLNNLGGNAKITGLNLTDGFVLQFDLGGDIQNLTLLFDYDSDVYQQTPHSFPLILITNTEISLYLHTHYLQSHTNELIVSNTSIEELAGFYTLEVIRGILTLKKDSNILFTTSDIPEMTRNDLLFISSITPNTVEDVLATWIDNIDIRLPPPISSLECTSKIETVTQNSSLSCICNIDHNAQANVLECKSNVHEQSLLRTSFDGDSYNEDINCAYSWWNPLPPYFDPTLHKLRLGNGEIDLNNLDLSSHGFNLRFEIDLMQPRTNIEQLIVVFNNVGSWVGIDQWELDIEQPTQRVKILHVHDVATWPPYTATDTILDVPFTGSIEGNYEFNIDVNGVVNFWLNNQHIISDLDTSSPIQPNTNIAFVVNNPDDIMHYSYANNFKG